MQGPCMGRSNQSGAKLSNPSYRQGHYKYWICTSLECLADCIHLRLCCRIYHYVLRSVPAPKRQPYWCYPNGKHLIIINTAGQSTCGAVFVIRISNSYLLIYWDCLIQFAISPIISSAICCSMLYSCFAFIMFPYTEGTNAWFKFSYKRKVTLLFPDSSCL